MSSSEALALLVCVDGSAGAEKAFQDALRIITEKGPGGMLHVLHVKEVAETSAFDPFHDVLDHLHNVEEKQRAEKIRAKYTSLCEAARVKYAYLEVEDTSVRQAICDQIDKLADRLDLVAIGRRGHGTLTNLLLGSVSQYVVENSVCPVMVAHSPQHHKTT